MGAKMMTNELANERKIYLDFTPASLDMTNYDELKKEVEKYAARYNGLVFSRDEKAGANQARTELLALHNAIEVERKNVKSVYNEPLQEFENKIKVLTDLINKPLNDIRDGLKMIDEAEKSERGYALKTLLEAKFKEKKLDIKGVIKAVETNSKWLNKGNWTAKLNPVEKLEAEIDSYITQVVKEIERRETEVRILKEFCKAQEIDPVGWIALLDHQPAMEVIELINLERERRKKLDEERLQKKKEHDDFIARQQQEALEAEKLAEEMKVTQQTISRSTAIFSASLKIYGTEEQLNELNDFLINRNMRVEEIQEDVEEILDRVADWSDDMAMDDLPF